MLYFGISKGSTVGFCKTEIKLILVTMYMYMVYNIDLTICFPCLLQTTNTLSGESNAFANLSFGD